MYKEYQKDTGRELKRRNTRNNKFKKYLLKENRSFIKTHKNIYKGHKRKHYATRVDMNKRKSLIRKNKRYAAKVDPNYLDRVKRPTKENGTKIAKAKMYITLLDRSDSIIREKKKISLDNVYHNINTQNKHVDSTYQKLLLGYQLNRAIAKYIKPYRFYYNEYSAPFVNAVKDTIAINDSLNKSTNQQLLQAYDSLFNLKDSIANFYSYTFVKIQQQQLKNLKGLKKTSMIDMGEKESYQTMAMELKDNYMKMNIVYDSILEIDKTRLPEFKSYMKWNKKTIKQFKQEVKLEYKRYHLLRRHYRHMYIFYKRQAIHLQREVAKRMSTTKQEINYLNKEIKKRKAKIKKKGK